MKKRKAGQLMNRSLLIPPRDSKDHPYICFSFSKEDTDTAMLIISQFNLHGFFFSYNQHRLECPEDARSSIFHEEYLKEKMKNCEIVFFLLSPQFLADPFCMNDYLYAVENKLKMAFIQIGDIKLSPLLFSKIEQYPSFDLSRLCPYWEDSEDTAPLFHQILYCLENSLQSCTDEKITSVFIIQKYHRLPISRIRPPEKPGHSSATSHFVDKIPADILQKISKIDYREKKRHEFPEEEDTDNVAFSILSPAAVNPDSYGIINLFMYTKEQREIVDQAIRESNGLRKETTKKGFNVSGKSIITARLESDDAVIRDPIETQTWTGESLHFDFQFYVPAACTRSHIAFVCYIECNGIPITRLNFLTAVTKKADLTSIPAKVTQHDFRKAFISYSHEDEQRMLERILGIHELVPDMIFWLDKQSTDAGVFWREEIKQAIMISDIFLLFWSIAASRSKEVEKEWRYGLEQKGLTFIAPVPLDPPEKCPPPEALQSLNFSVRAFSRNKFTKKLSFYDCRNLLII